MGDVMLKQYVKTQLEAIIVHVKLDIQEMELVVRVMFYFICYIVFKFNHFIQLFLDVDECELDNHNCDINAICTNAIGSFDCSCNIGYSGIGTNCKGVLF